jgi:hypothetical protein
VKEEFSANKVLNDHGNSVSRGKEHHRCRIMQNLF